MGIGEVTLYAGPLICNNSFSEVGEVERDRNANDDESVEDDGRQTTTVSTTTDTEKNKKP